MTPNAEQRSVIYSDSPRIVCLASPGSGKTATLIERIKYLIGSGVPPDKIVCITYTTNAAKELQSRLGDVKLRQCSTLHAWMLRLLREQGKLIGLPARLAVLDEQAAKDLLEDVIAENRYKGSLTAVKEEMPKIGDGRACIGAKLVAESYARRMAKDGLLDFDAILRLGLQLVRLLPSSALGEWMLVDEVQDSCAQDHAIYNAAKIQNKFFVGDLDQSIFGWRGGDHTFLAKLANESTCSHFKLETNYRSDRKICRAAQRLIEHNKDRVAKAIVPVSIEDGRVEVQQVASEAFQLSALVMLISRCKPTECAVLCRNNWQVTEVANALRSAGIPVVERKRIEKPLDWGTARDVVGFLANPENDYLAHRVLVASRGKPAADKIRSQAIKAMTSINQAVLHVGEIELEAVPEALTRLGIGLESLDRVKKAMADLGPEDRTLSALGLALGDEELWGEEVGKEGCTVSTIHSAKGREWDLVFLSWWNQENFPGKKEAEAMAEERRIAFVAVTRARHGVFILTSKTARTYGKQRQPSESTPSMFIQELGLTL